MGKKLAPGTYEVVEGGRNGTIAVRDGYIVLELKRALRKRIDEKRVSIKQMHSVVHDRRWGADKVKVELVVGSSTVSYLWRVKNAEGFVSELYAELDKATV